jgi:farnesyl-diphosphate farnesyltransferase
VRNRPDDWARGVDFYPEGWTTADLATYARAHLVPMHAYLQTLPPCAVQQLCIIPLALALATLDALAGGAPKLSRAEVHGIVAAVLSSDEVARLADRSTVGA